MITVVTTVDTGVPEPRIKIDITGNAFAPLPVPSASLITIYRLNPDGSQHRVIVETGARLSGGIWSGFDYHAPFNQPVSYIVQASGYTSTPVTVTLPSTVPWLMHPTNPSLSVDLDELIDIGDQTADPGAVLSWPFGASEPIALTDGARHAPAGSLKVLSRTKANLDALKSLLEDAGPVLMNLAATDQGADWWDADWAWIQPGQVNYGSQKRTTGFRITTIPYQVIATPAGAVLPIWTIADVVANYATCAAVVTAFATVSNLTTNTTGAPPTGSLIPDPSTPGLFLPSGLTEDPSNPGLYLLPA